MVLLLFTGLIGCMAKRGQYNDVQIGPEMLLIDRQGGFSSKPSLTLQTKSKPFGNEGLEQRLLDLP